MPFKLLTMGCIGYCFNSHYWLSKHIQSTIRGFARGIAAETYFSAFAQFNVQYYEVYEI